MKPIFIRLIASIVVLDTLSLLCCANYDRALTVFSDSGQLLQLQYADQAVLQGSLVLAACNGKDSVALCVVSDSFRDNESIKSSMHPAMIGLANKNKNIRRKLVQIDEGVYATFSGLAADGRVMFDKMRLECQNYRMTYGERPSLLHIARHAGDIQHRYTLRGGGRPFGVACIIAGFDIDSDIARVFRTDPSGAVTEWRAVAIGGGKSNEVAMKQLEKEGDTLKDLRGAAIAHFTSRAALMTEASLECIVLLLERDSGLKLIPKWLTAKKVKQEGNKFEIELNEMDENMHIT